MPTPLGKSCHLCEQQPWEPIRDSRVTGGGAWPGSERRGRRGWRGAREHFGSETVLPLVTSAPPGSALERIRCAAASEIAFAGAKCPWRTGKGGCRAHEVPGCEGFILALSLKPKAPGTLVVALLGKGHGDRLTRKGSLSLVAVSEAGRALSFWPNKETPPEPSPEAQIRAKQPRGLITYLARPCST